MHEPLMALVLAWCDRTLLPLPKRQPRKDRESVFTEEEALANDAVGSGTKVLSCTGETHSELRRTRFLGKFILHNRV